MGTQFMSLSRKPVCGGGILVTVALLLLVIFSDPAKAAPALKQQDISSEATIQYQVESEKSFLGAVNETNKDFATAGEAKGVTIGREQHDGLQNSKRPEDVKALITKMKEQLELQDEELAIWRQRASLDSTIGNILMVVSIIIAILTVFWTLMSAWILPKIIRFEKDKKKLSNLLELEMSLAEIQQISFRESLDQMQLSTNIDTTKRKNIDTTKPNLNSLDLTTYLRRLTAVAEDIVATSCESLPQLLALLPKTKAKVISYVAWLLGSDLLSDANYNKRIEKLLSNLSE